MATDAGSLTVGGRAEAQFGTATTVGGEAYRRNWNTETSMAGMAYMAQFSIPDVDVDDRRLRGSHPRPRHADVD